MTGPDDPWYDSTEESFQITWYDEEPKRADGGSRENPTADSIIIETRERVVGLESDLNAMSASVSRIERQMEHVSEEVEAVRDGSLAEERFEDQYAPKIDMNYKVAIAAKWLGGFIILILTTLGFLLEVGWI